jgi:general stress protein 26
MASKGDIVQRDSIVSASNKYLSVSGVAEVCTDRAKIAELWTEEWKLWFPGGKDDANLALLRVCLVFRVSEDVYGA